MSLRVLQLVGNLIIIGLFSTVASAQLQVTAEKGYLRSAIEKYPPAKRRPLVEYLDAAKIVSDKAAQLYSDGNITGLYEVMLPLFKQQVTLAQFRDGVASIEAMEGKIIAYRYRNQALVYPDESTTTVSDLPKAQSEVYYSVTTTKSKDDTVFLIVKTYRNGNQHFVAKVNFQHYGANIPSWLQVR